MPTQLISRKTIIDFRELLVRFVLREIDDIFSGANIEPTKGPPAVSVSGDRRFRVEQYLTTLDLSSRSDAERLAAAFAEVIERLERCEEGGFHPGASDAIAPLLRRMEADGWKFEAGRFTFTRAVRLGVEPAGVLALSESSIEEHVAKAKQKVDAGDYAGAITNAYTMVESFLKLLLTRLGVEFKRDEGDIKTLYGLVVRPLNLSPGGENLESFFKPILQGLKGQVSGLYEVANKAADRHARRYHPARHHATLAVNSAFTLCEFLLGSFEHRSKLGAPMSGVPRVTVS
jgi:hypothetical protein